MSNEYVTFTIAELTYGVPVEHVRETLGHHPRTRVPLATPGVAGLVNLRGQVVVTLDLRGRLGAEPLPEDGESMMVVLEVDGEVAALLVDVVGDVLEIPDGQVTSVPDTLAPQLRELVTGVHKLDDGLVLVLDVHAATAVRTTTHQG